MPPKLALLLGFAFVGYMFWRERGRVQTSSKALLLPLLWLFVGSSRPFGAWLLVWGVPIGGGGGTVEDGSSIDRAFYLGLLVVGLIVLARRPVDWGRVLRENRPLLALLGFMLISVSWSDYSYVSFKRFVKVIGSVVMALVVLTEQDPFEALRSIIRRCALIHLPMSIIFVKYFPMLGMEWTWNGAAASWKGIATSKNVLGQFVMVAGIYFLSEATRNWWEKRWKQWSLLYLGMALYLLKGSDDSISLTSVSVFVLASLVFLGLGKLKGEPVRQRYFLNLVTVMITGLVLLVTIHSVVMFSEQSFFGKLITAFGRDITLTGRTEIWGEIYDVVADHLLIGIGYGGFWIGEIANIPWSNNMTWTLFQGHNGYIDTFLQIGWIGVGLLLVLLASTYKKLIVVLWEDFERGRFLMTLLITIVFVNTTESTFLRGTHQLWILFLFTCLSVKMKLKQNSDFRV